MAEHIFPQLMAADTAGIAETNYPEELHNISSLITYTEVEKALGMLPSYKAPGPDGIPNRLLKKCKITLSKDLAYLFNACFFLGTTQRVLKNRQQSFSGNHRSRDTTPQNYIDR